MQESRREQGQSLVEITLALPVLIILFLGIAEVGFLLFAHVQVANAVREGARHGALCHLHETCGNLETEVEAAVLSEAQTLLNTGNTTVNVEKGNLDVGTPLTVTVTYSHTAPFVSTFVPMFPATIPVEHALVMHYDR